MADVCLRAVRGICNALKPHRLDMPPVPALLRGYQKKSLSLATPVMNRNYVAGISVPYGRVFAGIIQGVIEAARGPQVNNRLPNDVRNT